MARLPRAFRLIAARRTRCACASLDRPSSSPPFSSLKFAARDHAWAPEGSAFQSSRGAHDWWECDPKSAVGWPWA